MRSPDSSLQSATLPTPGIATGTRTVSTPNMVVSTARKGVQLHDLQASLADKAINHMQMGYENHAKTQREVHALHGHATLLIK